MWRKVRPDATMQSVSVLPLHCLLYENDKNEEYAEPVKTVTTM